MGMKDSDEYSQKESPESDWERDNHSMATYSGSNWRNKPVNPIRKPSESSLVVHERVVIVTPRVMVTKPTPRPGSSTPDSTFSEVRQLANIANDISPMSSQYSECYTGRGASEMQSNSRMSYRKYSDEITRMFII